MKIIVIALMIIILLLNSSLRTFITMICTVIWLFYTIYVCIMLFKNKEQKLKSNDKIDHMPNNALPELIRYFYIRKVDNKVFIAILFNMIAKEYISLIRQENEYYFINNVNEEITLTKSEEYVKKILFREIGNGENVSLSAISKMCKVNSGYLYNEYDSFKTTFEFESAKEKYFKPTRNLINNTLFYLVISFILSIYNLLFTPNVVVFVVVFITTSILSIIINNFKNVEDEKVSEYIEWLKFRNYIIDTDLSNLDIEVLEEYSLYAYVLDCFDEFKLSLDKKYQRNNACYNDNLLLQIINSGVFDDIEKDLNKSLDSMKSTVLLFKRNKGRRISYDR